MEVTGNTGGVRQFSILLTPASHVLLSESTVKPPGEPCTLRVTSVPGSAEWLPLKV